MRHDQADRRLLGRQGHDPRPQPELRRLDRQPRVPSNNVDGIQIAINTNLDDSFQKLLDGDLDEITNTPPKNVLLKFETDPNYANWLHSDSGDRTWYVTMNLLAPPFDDVHVRRAVNFMLDRDGIRKAYGGEKRGDLATSVEPPTVLPQSTSIDPYNVAQNPNGNLQSAQDEMKQSSYDKNQNGVCDDGGACDNIVFLGRSEAPWPEMNQVAMQSLQQILPGLTLKEVDTSTGYTTLQNMPKLIPISLVPGWGKDYNSPYGFDYYIFSSDGIFSCTAATNYSLLGITKELLAKIDPSGKECGVGAALDAYNQKWGAVPDISKQINDCVLRAEPGRRRPVLRRQGRHAAHERHRAVGAVGLGEQLDVGQPGLVDEVRLRRQRRLDLVRELIGEQRAPA